MQSISQDEVEEILPGWQAASQAVAQQLAEWRRAHPKATLAQIEDAVFEAMQKLQARALGQVVHASAVTDVAAQPSDERPRCPTCGGQLEPRGRQRRSIRPVRQRARLDLDRSYAVCATCGAGLFPLDEELGLLPGQFSATLAEGVARLGTKLPFEQAVAEVAFFWSVELEETTVRRHTQAAGAAYVAVQAADLERLERERPLAPDGPAVQYLRADGAMVPLVRGDWAEVKTLAIGEVEMQRGADGLPEAHTTDLSYFSRLADAESFTRQAYVEAHRRGTETAKLVCAVQDGAEWERGLVDVLRADAVRILDFPHAIEHLTAAAQPVPGAATPELKAWLDEQAHTLKHAADGARQVLSAVAKLPVQRAADPTAAVEARDRTMTYFTKRLAQLQYAAFQSAGYPIGSGSTESANKLVVEARLKGSGMHWARAHVDPLVALRTVACANRWPEAWPRICARLRADAEQRRRSRWQLRHPTPTVPVKDSPSPAVVTAAQPSPAATPSPRRGKSIVNGRPTALHPWKRFGYDRRHDAPRDLRFPC